MGSSHKPKTSNLYTLLYMLASIPSVTAICYDPNGDIESDPIFQPCGNSMCCATNRTNPSGGNYANGFTADICLENGLCENEIYVTYGDQTTLVTLYYRDYCTSSNWTDGSCLDVCTEKTNPGVGISNSTVVMTPCDGTANSSSWCCGDSSSCCGSDSAISIAQTWGFGLPTTTTTSSSIQSTIPTTAATAPQSPTSTSSSSTSPSSSPSPGLSAGAKAGIGVGVSLGTIGIISLVLALFIIGRRRISRGNEEGAPRPSTTTSGPRTYSYMKPQEKPDDPIPYVGGLPANQRYELPSEHT